MTEQEIKKIIEKEVSNHFPVGMIFAFPAEYIPENFLPCEGQELSKKQYPILFALIGNSFGGSGNTFCLPDLQGQFIRGLDREGNLDITDDGDIRKIGSIQNDAMQGHKHIGGETNQNGSHKHEYYDSSKTIHFGTNTFSDNESATLWQNSTSGATNNTAYSGSHSHTYVIGSVSNDTYGKVRVASETRPTNVALIFCIKVK